MICQLAVLHGPDHIAIVAVVGRRDERRVGLAEMASTPSAFMRYRRGGSARLVYPSVSEAANDVSDRGDATPARRDDPGRWRDRRVLDLAEGDDTTIVEIGAPSSIATATAAAVRQSRTVMSAGQTAMR